MRSRGSVHCLAYGMLRRLHMFQMGITSHASPGAENQSLQRETRRGETEAGRCLGREPRRQPAVPSYGACLRFPQGGPGSGVSREPAVIAARHGIYRTRALPPSCLVTSDPPGPPSVLRTSQNRIWPVCLRVLLPLTRLLQGRLSGVWPWW